MFFCNLVIFTYILNFFVLKIKSFSNVYLTLMTKVKQKSLKNKLESIHKRF